MTKAADRDPSATPSVLPEEEAPGGEVSVRRIQILNLCFAAAACLGGLAVSGAFSLGVLAGGAVMAVSFSIIATIIRSVFTTDQISPLKVGIYWAKFAGILLIVGVLILVFRLDPIGILVGLSTILVAITTEAVLRMVGK